MQTAKYLRCLVNTSGTTCIGKASAAAAAAYCGWSGIWLQHSNSQELLPRSELRYKTLFICTSINNRTHSSSNQFIGTYMFTSYVPVFFFNTKRATKSWVVDLHLYQVYMYIEINNVRVRGRRIYNIYTSTWYEYSINSISKYEVRSYIIPRCETFLFLSPKYEGVWYIPGIYILKKIKHISYIPLV